MTSVRTSFAALLAIATFASCALVVGIVRSQESEAPASTQEAAASPVAVDNSEPPASQVEPANPKIDIEKKKKVVILLSAVAGVAICGIGAIAGTMLWARHLRRLARDIGPPQTTIGNDFWFLKPPKPVATKSDISDSHRPPHTPPEAETSE